MTHWDGLTSSTTSGDPQRICILGATNRIQDIDEAILRRMPKKFPVNLPSALQRRRILRLVLKDTRIDPPKFDEDILVSATAGLSGSDIKEACRDAAMVPVREFIRSKKERGESMNGLDTRDVRGLRTEDFFGRSGTAPLRNYAEHAATKSSSRESLYETDSELGDAEPISAENH